MEKVQNITDTSKKIIMASMVAMVLGVGISEGVVGNVDEVKASSKSSKSYQTSKGKIDKTYKVGKTRAKKDLDKKLSSLKKSYEKGNKDLSTKIKTESKNITSPTNYEKELQKLEVNYDRDITNLSGKQTELELRINKLILNMLSRDKTVKDSEIKDQIDLRVTYAEWLKKIIEDPKNYVGYLEYVNGEDGIDKKYKNPSYLKSKEYVEEVKNAKIDLNSSIRAIKQDLAESSDVYIDYATNTELKEYRQIEKEQLAYDKELNSMIKQYTKDKKNLKTKLKNQAIKKVSTYKSKLLTDKSAYNKKVRDEKDKYNKKVTKLKKTYMKDLQKLNKKYR